MKKLSIYITVLLAAALTACNEDFNEGVASPQSYGQEEAADKITFTATGVAPINLGNVEEESVAVAVFTTPAVEEEATLSYKMKLDNKVTFNCRRQRIRSNGRFAECSGANIWYPSGRTYHECCINGIRGCRKDSICGTG